jgi:hypothetical protein
MPHGDPDPRDPFALRGVEVPAEEGDVVAMAKGFAEEFAAAGWDEPRLLAMFKAPFYLGPHLAWQQLGEKRVREIVAEAVRPWSRFRDARAAACAVSACSASPDAKQARRNAHA